MFEVVLKGKGLFTSLEVEHGPGRFLRRAKPMLLRSRPQTCSTWMARSRPRKCRGAVWVAVPSLAELVL